MRPTRAIAGWGRVMTAERALCLHANRACRFTTVRWLFTGVSRLGDGVFWYVLMLVLPLTQGRAGAEASLRMAAFALAGLAAYKWVKARTARPRPCATDAGIRSATRMLDQYSFPSGHTLHAVGFTTVAAAHFPALTGALAVLTVLIACSRVVLGLHYPTDVAMGASMGYAIARGVLEVPVAY
ncbi:hypothetical protein KBTX_00612 [wastewater metagenome]|uniref:Phosphatidic acid phosphatase type 2/haloperoxidase domain-containing protein n=3 Tax=root TaxID=1 RepID=A0A5B8R9W7_9ZZZZ|nr:hypothetical protein KBTEX_00612 [uncultured organism]